MPYDNAQGSAEEATVAERSQLSAVYLADGLGFGGSGLGVLKLPGPSNVISVWF